VESMLIQGTIRRCEPWEGCDLINMQPKFKGGLVILRHTYSPMILTSTRLRRRPSNSP
jgi:hypothetical protein